MSIIEKAAARLAEKQRKEHAAAPEVADAGETRPPAGQAAETDIGAGPVRVAEAVPMAESRPAVLEKEAASPMGGTDSSPDEAGKTETRSLAGESGGEEGGSAPESLPEAPGSGSPPEASGRPESSEEPAVEATRPEGSAAAVIPITQLDPDLVLSPEGGRDRLAEEFRLIKRPLVTRALDQRERAEGHPNLIMVTSSLQAEGKSFVSLNLAISIAMEMDSTVLLVDADVAKPGLSRYLGIADRPGLIDRLVDERRDLTYLLQRTDIPKLTVLPAGSRHKRSTELLASSKMRALLDEMASRYADRIVLFDSPPLLESTEAGVLAAQMGQVVFVVASETTSQMLVKEALTAFDHLDNVSVVLNKVRSGMLSGKYGYAYGYGYGYGSYGEAQE